MLTSIDFKETNNSKAVDETKSEILNESKEKFIYQ